MIGDTLEDEIEVVIGEFWEDARECESDFETAASNDLTELAAYMKGQADALQDAGDRLNQIDQDSECDSE